MILSELNPLRGKKIVVCVTGSVAAIETPKLVRELRRHGARVFCVMSESARKIIHPYVLEWASENPVVTEITGKVEHVRLVGEVEGKADLLMVAPCTANTLGKMANGIDDTPVTTFIATAFGSGIPVILVPAMHISMYEHPIVEENIKKLKELGVDFMEPRIEEGKAKFPEIKRIIDHLIFKFTRKDLLGKRILVTAGPTIEEIDAVRYITNKSSGKMGVWLAEEAYKRGARVTLVRGNTAIEPAYPLKDIKVKSAEEMLTAVEKNIDVDVMIHAAAVSDFTVEKRGEKIPSSERLCLELSPTPKILERIKDMNDKLFLVGFKAEYRVSEKELIERAFEKLKVAKADLIVANDVGKEGIGFGSDMNEVFIINQEGKSKHFKLAHKRVIANQILDEILEVMKKG